MFKGKVFEKELSYHQFLSKRFNGSNSILPNSVVVEPDILGIEISLSELLNKCENKNQEVIYEVFEESQTLIEKLTIQTKDTVRRVEIVIVSKMNFLRLIKENLQFKELLKIGFIEKANNYMFTFFEKQLQDKGLKMTKNKISYDMNFYFQVHNKKEYIIVENPLIVYNESLYEQKMQLIKDSFEEIAEKNVSKLAI